MILYLAIRLPNSGNYSFFFDMPARLAGVSRAGIILLFRNSEALFAAFSF